MTVHNPGDVVVSRVLANIKSLMPLQGMNSDTYLAHDPQLNADVVLKEVKYGSLQDMQRALAEVQRLYSARHPHVASAQYAADTGQNIIRVVMPLYQRGSLHEVLNGGPLAINNAIRYTGHILLALGHVHSLGLIHADVKPSNILLDNNDHAVLTDFGQSVAVRPTDQLAVRPPMYGMAMPPEAFASNFISRQADVYQAGLMLYRLLNGHKLWQQQVARAVSRGYGAPQMTRGTWPDRHLWLPHVPAALRSVVRKAMNPDLARRFATVDEFANALGRVSIPVKLGECKPMETSDGWEWKHRNGPQEYNTVLRSGQKGGLEIASTRTNTLTQKTENLNSLSQNNLRTLPEAFGRLEVRFRQA